MKKAYVFPSRGIGDAIIMMIASHYLLSAGYEVITFHPALLELSDWFPNHKFSSTLRDTLSQDTLSQADLLIVQSDNTTFQHKLSLYRGEGHLPNLSIFYPSYNPAKHAPLDEKDQVFDPNMTMTDNLCCAVSRLLSTALIPHQNGLTVPSSLFYRKNEKRIILHPTSSDVRKNWGASQFIALAKTLCKQGYEPIFSVSPKEREQWKLLLQGRFPLPYFPTLADLAGAVYESGYMIGNDSVTGHLASNLNIPTLIIANDRRRMRLWRPGWRKGEIITPSPLIPNWKGLRLREQYWQKWIRPSRVLRTFYKVAGSL